MGMWSCRVQRVEGHEMGMCGYEEGIGYIRSHQVGICVSRWYVCRVEGTSEGSGGYRYVVCAFAKGVVSVGQMLW